MVGETSRLQYLPSDEARYRNLRVENGGASSSRRLHFRKQPALWLQATMSVCSDSRTGLGTQASGRHVVSGRTGRQPSS